MRYRAIGSKNGQAKLTESDIPLIRALLAEGLPHRVIAEKFGVHPGRISHIKLGISWCHV